MDFETANTERASVCAVGMVRVRDGVEVDSFYRLVRPPAAVNWFELRHVGIHGITPADVRDAPSWGEVCGEVLEFVGDDVLVPHNASFDMSALRAVSALEGAVLGPGLRYMCSLVLSRRALALRSHSLPLVAAELGVPVLHHHDAGEDARVVALVVAALAGRVNAETLEDLAGWHGVPIKTLLPVVAVEAGPVADEGGGRAPRTRGSLSW